MAEDQPTPQSNQPAHRGRIQAQNGGTEKSVSWAQAEAPTVSKMLQMVNQLEQPLRRRELRDRRRGLAQLRNFIRAKAKIGGVPAVYKNS